MADYGRFSQSGPFRALLNQFVVEGNDDGQLLLVHNDCGAAVCEVEDGDDMSLLVQTVINHDC